MIRVLILLCTVAVSLMAQRGTYTYERTTTAGPESVTLHIASGSNRTARLVGITVYCATACTVALKRDGTAPTGTLGTVVKLNSSAPTAGVAPYYSSDVGAGTTVKNYNVAAAEEKIIDLPDKGIAAGENVTITVSLSGARVYFQWREY